MLLEEQASAAPVQVAPPTGHFHPKGKPPSRHTLEVLRRAKATLPFNDRRDFEEQAKGFIAPMKDLKIKADAGHVAWDMERYQFFNERDDFDSVHPSLTRISKLNMNYGLYKVTDDIYQVRGLDISDLTLVRGRTGWIIFDIMLTRETARAAWKLFQEHVGEGMPVTAVIYSHSHVDHWGGVRGIVDEADVRAGKVEIIAPRDFMHHTISENVYAGNAMNRRLFYQYGILLPASPYGHAGQGLGMNAANGAIELIPPTRIIEDDNRVPHRRRRAHGVPEHAEHRGADGDEHVSPGDEGPLDGGERQRAAAQHLHAARRARARRIEVVAVHERGAVHVRPGGRGAVPLAPLAAVGQRARAAGPAGPARHLREHEQPGAPLREPGRHDQPDPQRLRDARGPPAGLAQRAATTARPSTTAAASIQRFLGYWDCNPATLIPLSPADSAPLYVEMMGGAGRSWRRGASCYDAGKYFEATEILNKLVHAEPDNQAAKDLLADVYEQIGYQQENPGLRNSFLSGAFELRSGIPGGAAQDTAGPDVIRAMSTELFLNFLGIKMDTRKAEGLAFTINLITPDNGEKFVVELSNATLTNIEGFLADDPDLTLTINRTDLERTMMGTKTLEAQIADGTATVEGDVSVLAKLGATMVEFDPRFEVLPGTKVRGERLAKANAYEARPGAPVAE